MPKAYQNGAHFQHINMTKLKTMKKFKSKDYISKLEFRQVLFVSVKIYIIQNLIFDCFGWVVKFYYTVRTVEDVLSRSTPF